MLSVDRFAIYYAEIHSSFPRQIEAIAFFIIIIDIFQYFIQTDA